MENYRVRVDQVGIEGFLSFLTLGRVFKATSQVGHESRRGEDELEFFQLLQLRFQGFKCVNREAGRCHTKLGRTGQLAFQVIAQEGGSVVNDTQVFPPSALLASQAQSTRNPEMRNALQAQRLTWCRWRWPRFNCLEGAPHSAFTPYGPPLYPETPQGPLAARSGTLVGYPSTAVSADSCCLR